MKPSQRFIAGASCPQCNEQDALLIDSVDQGIECVECGFSQSAADRDQPNQEKPEVQRMPAEKVKVGDIIRIKNLKD